MARPSPFPSLLVVKNGLKSCSRRSAGMPGPLSAISTTTSPASPKLRADPERAGAPRHGLDRVEADVEEDLLELRGVGQDRR